MLTSLLSLFCSEFALIFIFIFPKELFSLGHDKAVLINKDLHLADLGQAAAGAEGAGMGLVQSSLLFISPHEG